MEELVHDIEFPYKKLRLRKCTNHRYKYCLVVTNAIRNTDELWTVGCRSYQDTRELFRIEPVNLPSMFEAQHLMPGSEEWNRHFDPNTPTPIEEHIDELIRALNLGP